MGRLSCNKVNSLHLAAGFPVCVIVVQTAESTCLSSSVVRGSRGNVSGGGCACDGVPPSEACGRMPEAAFLSPPPAGEMSPNSIPKYLKRPLWRERKCVGRGARGRATVGQRRARQSHAPHPRAPRPRRPAPPPAFQRASLPIYSAATRHTSITTFTTPGHHRLPSVAPSNLSTFVICFFLHF